MVSSQCDGLSLKSRDPKVLLHYFLARAEIFVPKYEDAVFRKGGCKVEFVVDLTLLRFAVNLAFDDIDRYKEHHLGGERVVGGGERLSDAAKRSAYVCKWICKWKPLHRKDVPNWGEDKLKADSSEAYALQSNEAFALNLIHEFIRVETGVNHVFRDEYYHDLLYDLTYRHLGDDGLLHIFTNLLRDVKRGHDTGAITVKK